MILNSYVRQETRVSCGTHMSSYFLIANGVKEGGVISAQLFTLYMNKLLLDLKQSGYRCHISDTFTGVLSYADDITLICPSKKSMCIKFGDIVNVNEIIKLVMAPKCHG